MADRLAELEVQIKADIRDLSQRITEAKKKLKSLKEGGEAAGKGLGGGSGVAGGSRRAGQAMLNMNRIAEDSRFGFLGIQNNIEPMVTSFGYLKSELGSSRAAFKALAKQLVGPVGLLFAFNAVIAAVVLLPKLFKAMGLGAKSAATDVAGFSKALNETIKVSAGLKQFEITAQSVQGDLDAVSATVAKIARQFAKEGGYFLFRKPFGGTEKTKQQLKDILALEKKLIEERDKLFQLSRAAALAEASGLKEVEKRTKNTAKAVKLLGDRFAETVIAARALEAVGFEGGRAQTAQELGMTMGPTTKVVGELRNTTKPAKEALKTVNRELQVSDLLTNSIADGFAAMAVNIKSVGDIAKSVFKEMISSLIRIAAFRFVSGLFGGPAGVAAGVAGGAASSSSISGAAAGQAASVSFGVSARWEGRDLLLGLERVKQEQNRLGVKIG